MSFSMNIRRLHCIPGSHRDVRVIYKSNLKHGESHRVESFSARFFGVSKARVSAHDGNSNEVYESEVQFFEVKEPSVYGGFQLDHIYSGTFYIRFPADPLLCENHPLFPPFDTVEPQALPPSGRYGNGNSIEYFYETCLIAADGEKRMERKQTKTLDFTPTREPHAMYKPRATITKEINFIEIAGQEGLPPAVIFELDYPTVVAQRQPFTLNLILKSSPAPDIFLHSWTIHLREMTCASVSDTLKESSTTDQILASEVHTTSLDARPLVNALPTTVLDDLTVPATCAASFATPNLQRTYIFHAVVNLQCGTCSEEVCFDTETVTVLGAELGSKGDEREAAEIYDPFSDGPYDIYMGRMGPQDALRQFNPA